MAATEADIYEMPSDWADIDRLIRTEKIRERLENMIADNRAQYKRNQYLAKLDAEKQELKLDVSQFKAFATAAFQRIYHKPFQLDSENSKIFDMLVSYFMNDSAFESMGEGFSLKKGLLLFGGVGCGKTSMMKMFQQNPKNSYVTISCRVVADEFADGGANSVQKYFNPEYAPMVVNNYFNTERMGICFDDLGTENESRHFGNQKNVIQEILLNRYDKPTDFIGKTHITTNLSGEQIGEVYGQRVRSRMREMFNTISFMGKKDRRV